MVLTIDDKRVETAANERIIDAIRTAGMDTDCMRARPLAAQMGGEVFNLGYIPRQDSDVTLLRYEDAEGMAVYERTLLFVFIAAVRKLFPDARVYVRYSMGVGLYIMLSREPEITEEDVSMIHSECRRIVDADVCLVRKRLSINDALAFFKKDGQHDKVDLLKWRRFSYFDVYMMDGYMDYFYGEMAPSTGYVRVFDVQYLDGAVLLLMPDTENPSLPSRYEPRPKLAQVYAQSDSWGRLMSCACAVDLNRRVENGSIHELIRVNEALHERAYAHIADEIASRKARAVMLAGPSSSGKTTSANRIATQLRVLGLDPIMLSLDDYYIDRDKIPADETGAKDLEHINTLDTERFNADLVSLLAGRETLVPEFDFMTGRRAPEGRLMKLHGDQPLIIEGIHGLNPSLIAHDIDPDDVYRIYVSALTTLNLDDHNRIKTTDVRLLRRLVRDYRTRNAPMELTLSMWQSVRRGEERWIFPYQENADIIFNTTLHYELCVLRKHVYPLLQMVPQESRYYCMSRRIVKFLNYFTDADVEAEIPPTSVLREFIGGNVFYD
ncbi:MAG: nucleoside kinase [Clostridia bacterium]|nr:nucleoside kinase [Clostridia bacterium]